MHDAFLLLTPVLTLAVVALAGFIGCDVILGLERDPNPPRNLMAVPGNNRIDLSWDPPKAGMVGKYVVHIGTSSGMYSSTHETEDSDPEYSDTDAINGSMYFYAVSAKGSAEKFLYAPLANPVTLDAGADYYLVSEEFNAGDQWYDADTTVAVTAVASRVYAVNGDGAGSYNVAAINAHAYGPVDLQH